MEPGRQLFPFMDSCNEAQCTGPKLAGSVVVVSPSSYAATSPDGSRIRLGLTPTARMKRSAEESGEEEEEGVRVKRSADQIVVQTPDGRWTD